MEKPKSQYQVHWSPWAEALEGHPEAHPDRLALSQLVAYPKAHPDPVKWPAMGCAATFMLALPSW